LELIWIPQLAQLEKEVKERSKKDVQKEQAEAEAHIINPGLMITNGPTGYVYIYPKRLRLMFVYSFVGQAPLHMNGMMPVSVSSQ
jgi:clathrin heavy chain